MVARLRLLCVAKFPSRNDDYDVALWEHHSHLLAKTAGVVAAETSVIETGGKHHALLSKRFDRTANGRRKHFASAMTLLGLTDGCDAKTGHGYLDIVDFILQNCCDVESNLRQLYRRVAFNIAIGNSDDHFRNHGFLLTSRGWTLAPAYDMNPTLNDHQSLLINSNTNRADLDVLLASSEEFMINKDEARQIIEEVKISVSRWNTLAKRLGIAKREMDTFGQVYEL
ncbi:MAG: HipA domain-containing protein [Bacteroidales bacterium]|nr:HipA domain-containing protein [Bacteroidales bacterium]